MFVPDQRVPVDTEHRGRAQERTKVLAGQIVGHFSPGKLSDTEMRFFEFQSTRGLILFASPSDGHSDCWVEVSSRDSPTDNDSHHDSHRPPTTVNLKTFLRRFYLENFQSEN